MITTGKKKRYSRLLAGNWQFFVVAGNFDYDRKKKKIHYDRKKKRYSHLSDGCAVLAITTGKKKIQSSVWWVVLLNCVSFWFWREIGSFFVVAGNFYYDQKKKRYSRLSGKF